MMQTIRKRSQITSKGIGQDVPSDETWRLLEEELGIAHAVPITDVPAWTARTTPPKDSTNGHAPTEPAADKRARKETAYGEAFLDLCTRQLPKERLLGYTGPWKRKLDQLIVDALQTPTLREAVAKAGFARIFPKLLGSEVQRLALERRLPDDFYNAILTTQGDGSLALKRSVRDAIRSTAGTWFHQHYRDPQPVSEVEARYTRTGGDDAAEFLGR